ncbi:MAG: D-aminoacyl-tRNA deacylase [Oscillospiraceae bacterium]|nr:D-aminoacyl-tRNA deacylase [Oscillospiraceae bacterium]
MRIVLQRVANAKVEVNGETTGEIGTGYLVLIGIGEGDTKQDADRLAAKIRNLRIFSDENDKINLSLADVDGSLLVVSQFTLYADCRKGNRPNFTQAAKPDQAEMLYNYFVDVCRQNIKNVQCGVFGADMKVTLTNDGPFTVVLE